MVNFEKASSEDISDIVEVSKIVFNSNDIEPPEGFNDYNWFINKLNSGFLFKITFNGSIIGGILIYKIGYHNFQIDRIFILNDYQYTGIGTKAISFLQKRFPEATVWFVEVTKVWEDYLKFLSKCGFFESCCSKKDTIRYIKLNK